MGGSPGRAGTRALVVWLVVCLLVVGGSGRAAGQTGERGGLSLEAVLRSAVALGPEIRRAERNITRAEGDLGIAAGAFAMQFGSFVTLADEHVPGEVVASERSVSYGLSAERSYRHGLHVRPVLSATRVEGAGRAASYRAEARLGVTLPLLRGRGDGIAAANERAAVAEVGATVYALRHVTAAEAYAAISAYWRYRAAAERLGVLETSLERAHRLVTETEALVAADERPSADLDQLRSNAALKRSQRIAAEQAVLEQRRVLGLAMGITPAEIEALALPVTPFPDPLPTGSDLDSLLAKFVDGALDRRPDLAAAGRRREAGRERLTGVWAELRPRFDLTFEVGYIGWETGPDASPLTPPFHRNMAGPSTRLFATYQMAAGDPIARGLAMQREAAFDQLLMDEVEVRRSVRTGLAVAAVAVRNSLGELREVSDAVHHARRAVEGELTKFRLGMSTQFDLIFAEDALTGALLASIEARLRYAEAIARLRFESGTLLDRDDGPFSVSASLLLDLRSGVGPTGGNP